MNKQNKDYKGFFHCDNTVRKDRDLSDIAKLVFSDIAYLYFLEKDHCCYAGNEFFANRYGKSKGTISKAVTALENKGYIQRFLDAYRRRTIYVDRSVFSKNNDGDDQYSNVDNPPDIDPSLSSAEAPMSLANEKAMDENYRKKFPHLYKNRNHGTAS